MTPKFIGKLHFERNSNEMADPIVVGLLRIGPFDVDNVLLKKEVGELHRNHARQWDRCQV